MSLNALRRSRKILFLDRDDTIIKDFGYLNDPDQVILLDGVVKALKLFRDHGYQFVVTTNQSGLTRRIVQIKNLEAIHQKIQDEFNKHGIRILDFYSAPYCQDHHRRKPGPGLTLNAMSDYGVDKKHSLYAGDKWRDLLVGFNLGGRTILVNEAKDQRDLFTEFAPDLCLPQWTDLTSKVLDRFLSGETLNLSTTSFDNSLARSHKGPSQRLEFKNK